MRQSAEPMLLSPFVSSVSPSGLTALPGNSAVTLNWTDNDPNATSYAILRSTNGGAFTPLATLDPSNSDSICTMNVADTAGDAGTITLQCEPSGLGDGSIWPPSGSLTITSSSDPADMPLGSYPLIATAAPSATPSNNVPGGFIYDNLFYPSNSALGGDSYLTTNGLLFGDGNQIEINVWGNGGGDYAFYEAVGAYYPIQLNSGASLSVVSLVCTASTFTDSTVSIGNTYQYEIIASDSGVSSGPSNLAQATLLGPPAKLVFQQQPANVPLGAAENPPIVVDVEDQYGNIVTTDNSTVALAVSTGPGSISGTTTTTAIGGIATFSDIQFDAVGQYVLRASDASLTQAISSSFSVTRDATSITLSSSLDSSIVGQPVTFTAQIGADLPSAALPSGSVKFVEGSKSLGTANINEQGLAQFTTTSLSSGSHSITAVYDGDSDLAPSESPPLDQMVSPAPVEQDIYQLYNPRTHDHILTASLTEYDTLGKHRWTQQGIAFQSYTAPAIVEGITAEPLYCLVSTNGLRHTWATSAAQVRALIKSKAWKYEGLDGYILPSPISGSVPIGQLRARAGGQNLLATSLNEYEILSVNGWIGQGIVGYVMPAETT